MGTTVRTDAHWNQTSHVQDIFTASGLHLMQLVQRVHALYLYNIQYVDRETRPATLLDGHPMQVHSTHVAPDALHQQTQLPVSK